MRVHAPMMGVVAAALAQPVCLSLHFNNQAGVFSALGRSVAISGNTAVIGVPSTFPPKVIVLEYSEDTGWTVVQELHQPDGVPSEDFGRYVAIEGEVLAVTSTNFDGNATHPGSVYIFRDVNGAWSFEEKLYLSLIDGPCSNCLGFGTNLAIDGGRIAVSATGGTNVTGYRARIHLFSHDGNEWVETHAIEKDGISGAFINAGLGDRLALRGDLLVGGAIGDNTACPPDWPPPDCKFCNSCEFCFSGAAFVFRYDPVSDEWIEEAMLMPDDLICDNFFGTSVATNGEQVLVLREYPLPRRFYVYDRDPVSEAWNETQQLPAPEIPDAQIYIYSWGRAVAILGDTFMAGGHGSSIQSGFVFVYQRTASGEWMQREVLAPVPNVCCGGFGNSVALTEKWAIVGAHLEGGGGAAYIYDMQPPIGDLTCDGVVGVADLLELLAAWGPCPPPGSGTTGCPADLNGDGTVGVADLLILLSNWG